MLGVDSKKSQGKLSAFFSLFFYSFFLQELFDSVILSALDNQRGNSLKLSPRASFSTFRQYPNGISRSFISEAKLVGLHRSTSTLNPRTSRGSPAETFPSQCSSRSNALRISHHSEAVTNGSSNNFIPHPFWNPVGDLEDQGFHDDDFYNSPDDDFIPTYSSRQTQNSSPHPNQNRPLPMRPNLPSRLHNKPNRLREMWRQLIHRPNHSEPPTEHSRLFHKKNNLDIAGQDQRTSKATTLRSSSFFFLPSEANKEKLRKRLKGNSVDQSNTNATLDVKQNRNIKSTANNLLSLVGNSMNELRLKRSSLLARITSDSSTSFSSSFCYSTSTTSYSTCHSEQKDETSKFKFWKNWKKRKSTTKSHNYNETFDKSFLYNCDDRKINYDADYEEIDHRISWFSCCQMFN